ncbi:MAG: hypothetical protein K2Y26_01875 [Gemmatimonadaceae bacterium]|nr:hypothetical protein [Gemmatimonadaceae bacterium]
MSDFRSRDSHRAAPRSTTPVVTADRASLLPAVRAEVHALRSDTQALWSNVSFLKDALVIVPDHASAAGNSALLTDVSDALDALAVIAERIGRRTAAIDQYLTPAPAPVAPPREPFTVLRRPGGSR